MSGMFALVRVETCIIGFQFIPYACQISMNFHRGRFTVLMEPLISFFTRKIIL